MELETDCWSGHWDSNPEPCADLALTPLIRRLLCQLSYAPFLSDKLQFVAEFPQEACYQKHDDKLKFVRQWSRWKELNRHRSIINRVLWPLSYTAAESCTLDLALAALICNCAD
jgi:hypothetical protein